MTHSIRRSEFQPARREVAVYGWVLTPVATAIMDVLSIRRLEVVQRFAAGTGGQGGQHRLRQIVRNESHGTIRHREVDTSDVIAGRTGEGVSAPHVVCERKHSTRSGTPRGVQAIDRADPIGIGDPGTAVKCPWSPTDDFAESQRVARAVGDVADPDSRFIEEHAVAVVHHAAVGRDRVTSVC